MTRPRARRAAVADLEPVAPTVDLRLGRWEDALGDVGAVDLLLTDPPFSEQTHAGALGKAKAPRRSGKPGSPTTDRQSIAFPPWTHTDVERFVDAWVERVRCWFAVMTDDVLAPHFRAEFKAADLQTFAPLPIVFTDGGFRMQGDGPASTSIWLVVARKRGHLSTVAANKIWRATAGYYLGSKGPGQSGGRGKAPWLTDALVTDYSDPGHVVCDPMAGHGGVLASARNLGRHAIGAEMDPAAHEIAMANLSGDRTLLRRLIAEGKPERPVDPDAPQQALFATL